MDEKRRKRRDFLQNMVISLLSLSAVLLFMQTQIYNLREESYTRFFSASGTQMDAAVTGQTIGLSAPVRVAVTGPYGRYASIAMTTDNEEFDSLGRILGEVLGSAGSYTDCGSQKFLDALRGTSVYYDFLTPLPLSVLAGLTGVSGEETASARSLAVAAGEGGVTLYLWDGEDGYRCCSTAVTVESLEAIVSRYELGNAHFAFDGLDEEIDLTGIAPYSLFLEEEPDLPVLAQTIPASDAETLLAVLQFNPNTKSRYTEANGTEVIVESGRTLRIRKDGGILYQSGGDDTLQVEAGEEATLQELAVGSGELLDALLDAAGSEASLYLEEVRQSGTSITLTYGYEVSGVPVRFFDGENAASVTLSGTTVTTLALRLRQYSATEEISLILPLRQAAAIAGRYGDTELFIGYADDGNGRVEARWLAE